MDLKKEEGTKVNFVAKKLPLNPMCHKHLGLCCWSLPHCRVWWSCALAPSKLSKMSFPWPWVTQQPHRLCVPEPVPCSFCFGAGLGVRSHISDHVFIHLVLGTWCRGIRGFAFVFLVPPWSCCWHPVEVLIHSVSLLGCNLILILLLSHVRHL